MQAGGSAGRRREHDGTRIFGEDVAGLGVHLDLGELAVSADGPVDDLDGGAGINGGRGCNRRERPGRGSAWPCCMRGGRSTWVADGWIGAVAGWQRRQGEGCIAAAARSEVKGACRTRGYFPMQKVEKMRRRRSSVVVAPVRESRGRRAA